VVAFGDLSRLTDRNFVAISRNGDDNGPDARRGFVPPVLYARRNSIMTVQPLQNSDLLAIIGLGIALSAYLATIRSRLLDEASKHDQGTPMRKKYKNRAKALTLADAPLIIGSAMLAIGVGLKAKTGTEIAWLIDGGLLAIVAALGVLIFFHIEQWFHSFSP
jgi:hypothetical protein